MTTNNALLQHVKNVAKEDVRLWFAPFVGAVTAVRHELRRASAQHKIRAKSVAKSEKR